MNENERRVVVRRMLLLIAVACIIMGLYTFRLIFLQLVNGDSFKAKATNTTDYKFTVTAARGNIVDSTGKRIATTSTGYNVVLNKLQMGDQDLDTMLQQIVELLRQNDEKWLDTLLISEPDAAGNYTFYGQRRQHQRPENAGRHEGDAGLAAVRHRQRCDGDAGGEEPSGKLLPAVAAGAGGHPL